MAHYAIMSQSPNEKFRNARLQLKLSQFKLARAMGKSLRTIVRYENGGAVPHTSLMAIKQLLAVKHKGRKSHV
jgi:transcriptional regulator with XRE-family HTH domain